jgi:hypothetical protein
MLVSGKPPGNGLPQHAEQRMPPFLPLRASASFSTGKSERPSGIIKFAVREQSGVRGLDRTAKHEISSDQLNTLIIMADSSRKRPKSSRHPANAAL